MTIISTQVDDQALTLTFVAEFGASVEQVWQLWSDPRRLERWWGPPEWLATFDEYDFVVGGSCRHRLTGPKSEEVLGWWTITAIEAPHRLVFDEEFADEFGEPIEYLEPMQTAVTVEATEAGARMTTVITFPSAGQMKQSLQLGMAEQTGAIFAQTDAALGGQ